MPKSVVVVAGVAGSGKSRTLHRIADGHELVDNRVYSIMGRRTCIYFSSAQELTCGKCDYKLVIENIKRIIEECESQGCDLLIIAFTMYVKKGRKNEDCIRRPLKYLRRKVKNVRLIYLRKDTARKIDLVDDLMLRLKAKTIKSNKKYTRQAREVLAVVRSVP